MRQIIIIIEVIFLVSCSIDTPTSEQNTSTNIAFVLAEGAYPSNNGSLWSISDGKISEVSGNPTGNTANSMAIHGNDLYVINNGSGNLVIYSVSNEGIVEPTGTVIDLDGSQPREILIINDKAYISQWIKHSIAIVDLTTFIIEQIELPGCSEGLTTDGTFLYTTIKYLNNTAWPYPAGNTIEKINLSTNLLENSFTVSNNPDMAFYHNGYLYVGSQYGDWPTFNYITEKIDPSTGELLSSINHGSEVVFGVDLSIHEGLLYRAYDKGIVSLNEDLSIDTSTYIGTEYTDLYSMAINKGFIYLGFGDGIAPDNIIILDFDGNEVENFEVGASPGSFAFWKSE